MATFEIFPEVKPTPDGAASLKLETWRTTPVADALNDCVDAWIKKHGHEKGCSMPASYGIGMHTKDPERLDWELTVAEGKCKGKTFEIKYRAKFDTKSNGWGLCLKSFEAWDVPTSGGGGGAQAGGGQGMEKLSGSPKTSSPKAAASSGAGMEKFSSGSPKTGSPKAMEKFSGGDSGRAGYSSPTAQMARTASDGQKVGKLRGMFEGGSEAKPLFEGGEKFMEVPGKPGSDRHLVGQDSWVKSPAGDSLVKTVDSWLKKYGKKEGLQDGWSRSFTLADVQTTDPKKLTWTVTIKEGKAGADLKKPGKLFWGKYLAFLDPSDGRWVLKKESLEVKDAAPASPKGGEKDIEKLKRERGYCSPPCVFTPNMFDPRFCRECQRFKPEKF